MSEQVRLIVAGASAAGPGGARPNDDRVLIDARARLYAIVDASGPTYGGWHRPTGVEPGLRALRRSWLCDPAPTVDERLRDALFAANRAMYDPAFFNQRFDGRAPWHPTASMTVLGVAGDQAALAQIGSTRAYLARDQRVQRVLDDHTWWTELAARGAPRSPEDVRVVTRVLGFAEQVEFEITRLTLRPRDLVVLCSDGVWFPLEPTTTDTIRGLARAHEHEPEALASELLAAARVAGTLDHHSAIVISVTA